MSLKVTKREALEELARRGQLQKQAKGLSDVIYSELFDKQVAFCKDPHPYKAALCTRRAGKTEQWPRYAVICAISNPQALIRIWAISRLRCKQLLWQRLLVTCAKYKIHVKVNETELEIVFDNGSIIRLAGADKLKEIEKKRGDKTFMEIVLEAQLYGHLLKYMIEDVIDPCLMDERQRGGGILCLEGTPGPVCAGLWYEITGRDDVHSRWQSIGNKEGVGLGWSVHRWSMVDNPFMPHARQMIAEKKKQRRWDDNNPTYRREYLGLWVNDKGALFYKFDEDRNTFTLDEVKPWGEGWEHAIGWDIGFTDSMALVVWGWHPKLPDVYEAYSWKESGALDHQVMEKIEELQRRGFNFVGRVADTQGGGKLTVEQVNARYSFHFEPAEKSAKAEHVRLMNDDFLTGHIRVQRGSPLASELATLPIDPEWLEDPDPTKPPWEAPNFPNHCCDAALYAWRKAYHFFGKPDRPPPGPGTQEYNDAQEAELERRIAERDTNRPWWEAEPGYDPLGSLGDDF